MTPHPALRIRTPPPDSPHSRKYNKNHNAKYNLVLGKFITCLGLTILVHMGIYIHSQNNINLYFALFFMTIMVFIFYNLFKSENENENENDIEEGIYDEV